ncbi:hypothetical protein Btru_061323 [Bulinus truncatus]|nr:hypothetical protein Btru_061323 [Bulinus truncatus]
MDGERSGVKPTSTTLGFDYLMTSLARLELNGDVSKEYSKLPPPHSFPCQVGKTEKVTKKNRFKDIVPYDHNRVILCPQSSTLIDDMDENADYINASFIRSYINNDGYIATQGPMLGTVEDFWSMVWSENSRLIAMMCRLVEKCQNQSYKYWPEVGECLDVDDVIIKTDLEDDRGTHVIRKIGLRHMKTGERRDVIHLQFLSWPDHSLPCLPTFLRFWKTFRRFRSPSSGPPIIHCGNGSQRTGLLIALDSLFTQWEVTSSVDVVNCVARMREDRLGFFLTEVEYSFLYYAAVEAYMSHQTDRPVESFQRADSLGHINNAVALNTQDILREYSFIDTKRTQCTDQRLISCNTNGNFLCPDLCTERPFQSYQLPFPCDTGSIHVTPVPLCHQSLKRQSAECPIRLRHSVSLQEHEVFLGIGGVLPTECKYSFLVTPIPASSQTMDFWQMMFDTGCQCVVRLVSPLEAATLQPDKMPQSTSEFYLSLTSHGPLRDLVWKTNLMLRTTSQALVPFDSELPSELTIRVFTVAWSSPDKSIPPTECVTALCQNIATFLQDTSTSLIAVQCRDGWSTSGLFCAAYNVMASLAMDKEVDVYLLARMVQNRLSHTLSQNDDIIQNDILQKDHIIQNDILQNNDIIQNDILQNNDIIQNDILQNDDIIQNDILQNDHIIQNDILQNDNIIQNGILQNDMIQNGILQNDNILQNDILQNDKTST